MGHEVRGEYYLREGDTRRVAWHPGEVNWGVVCFGIMKVEGLHGRLRRNSCM